MDFEAYLISKKIDSEAFRKAEAPVWESWNTEFGQVHPNSFTVQKLNLINPVRRKYPLRTEEKPKLPDRVEAPPPAPEPPTPSAETQSPKPQAPKPAVPRPVFKPKPKTD